MQQFSADQTERRSVVGMSSTLDDDNKCLIVDCRNSRMHTLRLYVDQSVVYVLGWESVSSRIKLEKHFRHLLQCLRTFGTPVDWKLCQCGGIYCVTLISFFFFFFSSCFYQQANTFTCEFLVVQNTPLHENVTETCSITIHKRC